ncbi:meiosis protein SPO22/ZIP4 like-domain-containing protein [Mariannaea sp. PMI_226]|nr:meiosis protein SPO22/ZIP4 like-domain-containing protein [Mariannaea sp. PMI_226]
MARPDPIASGRERKIRSVIDFADDLLTKLPVLLDNSSTETLLADVNHHIHTVNSLPQKAKCISPQMAKDLKDRGRKLWNGCIREKRVHTDSSISVARPRLFVRVRLLAFLIHVLAREIYNTQKNEVGTDEHVIYLLNLALVVGRVCIEGSDLDGARLGLHKVADYVERLKAMDEQRTHRDDIAMTKRFEADYLTMRMALAWKEDRLDVAEHMYSKAEALRHYSDPLSAEHMADTLQHIGSDLASKSDHKMALKWLRRAYELINSQEIEQLSSQSLNLRLAICHDLIQVLLTVGSPECIQEAEDLVTYVESEIGDKPVVLHWRLELLQKSPGEAFDTDACASILRRMIRSIDFSDAVLGFLLHNIKQIRDRSSQLAIGLLDELLLTKLLIFKNVEWIGKALVHRVWMSTVETEYSEGVNNLSALFDRVPLEYLMFKVSLIGWDHELGCECIDKLSRCSDKEKSRDILYACVREAQQVGDRLCTLVALKAVTERCGSETAPTAHLPCIMRCAIRLIHLIENQEEEGSNNGPGLTEDTCQIFEKAAEYARSDPRDSENGKIFTLPELEWFRKNAYNIGERHDIQYMVMRCHFIVSAGLVSQARAEDKIEEQFQRYVEMRRHIAAFDTALESALLEESRSGDERILKDMRAKAATLFVFDFEGAVCLRSWDELSQIVRKAKICKDESMYKAIGDCLLRSHAPGNVLYATMRLIINEIFELEDFDILRLAKYLRCLFQATLPLDDEVALQVVEQTLQIAREGNQMNRPLPTDELDWVVATTFNHAIDILARGDGALCHRWALKALDLAEYMDDNGYMQNIIRERVAKLGLMNKNKE